MNRGLPAVPRSHPSPLALEAVLLGQAPPDTARHAATCDACRGRLAAMERAGAGYSPRPSSHAARRAVAQAERRWRQRASLASLAPLAALLVFVAWARQPVAPPVTPTIIAAQVPKSVPRQGRELLEPRGGAPSPRLRQLALRGRALEFGQGTLEAAPGDGPTLPFTLVHTKVDARVLGLVSEVSVTQTFENPFAQPVEALYVFPLPDDAAVHELTLRAGGRVLRATVQKRAEARRQYETAKAEGRRAALLDQERPNVFTQSVANLLPGERVEVELRYVAPLHFDDGVFSFVFPMVVGPRFVPGSGLPGESEGSGTARDTDEVPDASRITPPVSRSGRDVEVTVRVEAGAAIEELWSVSHRLAVDRPGAQRATLALDAGDTVPNKDLIVRWRVARGAATAGVVAEGGAFALMLNPEPLAASAPATPKELVFLIDTSCSMNGPPLAAAKRAMGQALRRATEADTFMLIDFAERARSFHPAPLPATSANVGRALTYLDALPSGGSTNQLAGLRRALEQPEDPARVRLVLLMTDGFIGNEDEVLAATRALRGAARVFGFGVGSSVNHFLLSRLSEEGRGFYQFVRPDEDAGAAVERFVRRVARPLITDVTIDWGGLPVADTLPEAVPDLFDAQPLTVYGRYRGEASGTVVLRGRRAGVPVRYEVPVRFPAAHEGGRALSTTWARQQVERLSAQSRGRETPEVVAAITALGLEHHLVTKFTSLVATEDRVVTSQPVRTLAEPSLPVDATTGGDLFGARPGDAGGFGGLGLRGTGAGGSGLGSGTLSSLGGAKGGGVFGGKGTGASGVGLQAKSPAPRGALDLLGADAVANRGGVVASGAGLGTSGGRGGGGAAASGSSLGVQRTRGAGHGGSALSAAELGLEDRGSAGLRGGPVGMSSALIGGEGDGRGVGTLGTLGAGRVSMASRSGSSVQRGAVQVAPAASDALTLRGFGSGSAGSRMVPQPDPTSVVTTPMVVGNKETHRATESKRDANLAPPPPPLSGPTQKAPLPPAKQAALDLEPATLGSISRELVIAVIRAHGAEVRACAERQALLDPRVGGVLRVTWRLRADGRVLSVRAHGPELEGTPLARCVEASAMRWRFPAASGEWSITYPFRFTSSR